MNETETLSDYARVTDKLFDFGRCGFGNDVEVFWCFANNEVAHGPANDIGVIATFP